MASKKQTKTAAKPGLNVVELPLDEISTSDFVTQAHRRERFKEESLDELAESIKNQGLISPITVRPRKWRVINSPSHSGWDVYLDETETRRVLGGFSKEKVAAGRYKSKTSAGRFASDWKYYFLRFSPDQHEKWKRIVRSRTDISVWIEAVEQVMTEGNGHVKIGGNG